MSETKLTHGEMEVAEKKMPEMGWRQATLGAGVLCLVISLFISAGAKGSLGQLPVVIAGAGVVLCVIAAIAGVMTRFASKASGGKSPSA